MEEIIEMINYIKVCVEERNYKFFLEQRNGATLVLNIDTGIWKVDKEYNELLLLPCVNGTITLLKNMPVYKKLEKDRFFEDIDIKTEVDDKMRLLIFGTM